MDKFEALKRMVIDAQVDVVKAMGGNKSAGVRARKAMQEIKDQAQEVREEILAARGGE